MLILCPSFTSVSAADMSCDWVRSGDGRSADESGESPLALLPQDPEVVLVVPPHALSWHRVTLPKVPAKRLRAVLEGLLEERLLGEVESLHFALAPGARAGQSIWVCACERGWLRQALDRLEAAQRPVTRIVPAIWPGTDTSGLIHHAFNTPGGAWLASATPEGVCLLPLDDDTSPAALQACTALAGEEAGAEPRDVRWLADPAVLALAEERLQQRFEPLPISADLLRCAEGPWNLAQFDLSLSAGARLGQRGRQHWRAFLNAPEWRPARWGMLALLVSGVGGLNTAAWLAQRQVDRQAAAVEQILRESFPQVSVVLDAPAQMQQELRRLRAASGSLGPGDLEVLLAAVGSHLPASMAAPTRLTYEGGALVLSGWSATGEQLDALRQALQGQGMQVRVEGAQLRVEPAKE